MIRDLAEGDVGATALVEPQCKEIYWEVSSLQVVGVRGSRYLLEY